jgi:hypothetical protein
MNLTADSVITTPAGTETVSGSAAGWVAAAVASWADVNASIHGMLAVLAIDHHHVARKSTLSKLRT